MKKFFCGVKRKLSSSSGDSIAEVLIALLISAVALVMLASMITSSTSIIDKSRDNIETYYSKSSTLASQDGTPDSSGTVTISEHDGSVSNVKNVAVDYFVNSEHVSGAPVVTYRIHPNP